MRISVAKTVAVLGVVGVAAFGTSYATAAPSPHSKGAQPGFTTTPNVAYSYSTSTTGGAGDVAYNIPNPPKGMYYASFTANFYPAGSPSAPEQFSCSLIKNGTTMRAQSTLTSLSDSGFYAGVNGGTVIKIDDVAEFQVYCGTNDGSSWTWGTRPLQVSLVHLDGLKLGSLTQGTPKVHGDLSVAGTR